jgi:hypothetical protein
MSALFLLRATQDMAARRKGSVIPRVSQVAAPHNRLLTAAEKLVFARVSISNAGVSAALARDNASI